MRIEDTSTPVVVLSLSRAPLLHGAVGIARSLGRLGIPVWLFHGIGRMPADRSRYLRGTVAVDADRAGPEGLLEKLTELGERIGGRPILMPIDDVSALFVADHARPLQTWFRFSALAPELIYSLASKRRLDELCRSAGLPTPASVFPASREELAAHVETLGLPLVVKAIEPQLLYQRPQARSVMIVRTLTELLDAYDRAEIGDKPNVMLQEYVPGGAESIWMFNGYFDEESRCVVGFTGVKLRQCLPHTGPTSLGLCVPNSIVQETTERLLHSIGYKGIVDLGYRYDARDSQYKMLDINPRIGGTFRLFVGSNGIDVARAQYLDLTGQPVPVSMPRRGRKWMVEPYDLWASYLYHREGTLPFTTWLRSLRGVREGAWVALDDPAPFVAMAARSVRMAGARIVRPRAAMRVRRRDASGGPIGPLPLPSRESGQRPQDNGEATARQATSTYFSSQVGFWQDVYQRSDVYGVIHQHRQALALAWVDELNLPPGAHALEVGPGAGLTTAALLGRGLRVTAVDLESKMLEQSRELVRHRGLESGLTASLADAQALPFADTSFDLVVALGVLPWLRMPERAVVEMARVLHPGGYVVVNADNRVRLSHLVDPLYNPALRPVRSAAKAGLVAAGLRQPTPPRMATTMLRPSSFERILSNANLNLVRGSLFGFGPFTFFGRKVLPQRLAVRAHQCLQSLADKAFPVVRSTGAQYLVLARKPGAGTGRGDERE
jgi:predicted ATP-grasp superfamily ATP-dependent carboligase/ubiquinone/menaquinone biosynthesis C-methylase UbiE